MLMSTIKGNTTTTTAAATASSPSPSTPIVVKKEQLKPVAAAAAQQQQVSNLLDPAASSNTQQLANYLSVFQQYLNLNQQQQPLNLKQLSTLQEMLPGSSLLTGSNGKSASSGKKMIAASTCSSGSSSPFSSSLASSSITPPKMHPIASGNDATVATGSMELGEIPLDLSMKTRCDDLKENNFINGGVNLKQHHRRNSLTSISGNKTNGYAADLSSKASKRASNNGRISSRSPSSRSHSSSSACSARSSSSGNTSMTSGSRRQSAAKTDSQQQQSPVTMAASGSSSSYNQKLFVCSVCSAKFHVVDQINEHFVSSHYQEYQRELSSKSPPRNTNVAQQNEEWRLSDPHNPLKCIKCDFVGRWPTELQKHAASHSTSRPFKCLICSLTYKWRWDLAKHFDRTHPSFRNPYKKRDRDAARSTLVGGPVNDDLDRSVGVASVGSNAGMTSSGKHRSRSRSNEHDEDASRGRSDEEMVLFKAHANQSRSPSPSPSDDLNPIDYHVNNRVI